MGDVTTTMLRIGARTRSTHRRQIITGSSEWPRRIKHRSSSGLPWPIPESGREVVAANERKANCFETSVFGATDRLFGPRLLGWGRVQNATHQNRYPWEILFGWHSLVVGELIHRTKERKMRRRINLGSAFEALT